MSRDYGKYEPVIGLEVHAQMKTKSKAFCSCSTDFNSPPNTNVCPICIGHPGTLPVLNKSLVDFILKLGIALNCNIERRSIFARKNYFYPDLPKGYQISQYDTPICSDGYLEIKYRRIGIQRIHMEEDAGKSLHDLSDDSSLVDLNRSGIPLIEIVSQPDLRSAEEAYDYLSKLKQMLVYLDICDGNMEEGSLRCDVNVSVRLKGDSEYGTKCEVKNLNSFKNTADALDYEICRQIDILEKGDKVIHQTLTYDAIQKITYPMRSKEEAHDYRYFPEPDLVSVYVDENWISEIKGSMPELPDVRRARFINDYGLPEYDAEVLTAEKSVADFFESVVSRVKNPKSASNWVMGDVMRVLNDKKISIGEFWISSGNLAALINLIEEGKISNNIGRTVYEEMLKVKQKNDERQNPEYIIKEKNLILVSDENELERVVKKVLADNPTEAERYRNGEKKLLGFFIGKVMRETGGKADPKKLNEILSKNLN
ncbi:MAG: Asp-tRNA(Asn)/Glu-tRNA(Gln) amidotransferase subunit GatB [Ignavibacteria bacterium]|nr:Asp-tRNA(Asn)/Glu-tRNA(Gln) amidotransferase subunit GatB [Ignavibacteria bacterium]